MFKTPKKTKNKMTKSQKVCKTKKPMKTQKMLKRKTNKTQTK